jgi:hypothetical protein
MSNGNVEKAILAEMGKPHSGLIDRVTRHNQILLHNFRKAVARNCECQLMGCVQSFAITLVPNQVLYPKYCEAHRSEFRRQNFLRRFAVRPALYRVETFRVLAEPGSHSSSPG